MKTPANNSGEQKPTVTKPPFAKRLGEHLKVFVPNLQPDGYTPTRIEDHILPAAMEAWDSIAQRKLLHTYANHVRSSQAFAVNLFAPLSPSAISHILAGIFGPIQRVEIPYFEFEDTDDRLCESQSSRPHRTQVDVVLRGETTTAKQVALLVEVKLSEDDFGNCSAFTNPQNDSIHVCQQSGPFGNDAHNCFQLRNHGSGQRRLYDKYLQLTPLPKNVTTSGCWYQSSASQPMRNVALASVLTHEDRIETRYAVCAPLLHRDLWNHWDDVQEVLPREMVITLPAEVVASLHDSATYSYLRDRYFLEVSDEASDSTMQEVVLWNLIAEIDEQFEHNLLVLETHPGGGQYDCISLVNPNNGKPMTIVDFNLVGRIHIFAKDEIISLDNGWERSYNNDIISVATEIGTHAHLSPRRKSGFTSPWREMSRTIELFQRAGETATWEIGTLDYFDGSGIRTERYEEISINYTPFSQLLHPLSNAVFQDWFLVHERQKTSSAIIRRIVA